MQMKKISLCGLAAVLCATAADAAYSDRGFRREISSGLDVVSARVNADIVPDDAPGELGLDVYRTVGVAENTDMYVFVPTSMYLRIGGGMPLGFATQQADFHGKKYDSNQGYTAQIGMGWNLSSYVRGEFDFQTETFRFSGLKNYTATYNTLNAMLYFDFLRRYVQTGDITYRRRFVPFMGIGAGAGFYKFPGADGADGFVVGAPRAELGFNVMLNEVIGIDVVYQYQMMMGNGFGWGAQSGGVDSVSNVVASMRVNF